MSASSKAPTSSTRGVIFGTGFAPFRGGPLHYKAAQGGSEPARAAAE